MRACVRAFVCAFVRACLRAGESVSARMLCFSVCQFHFALYDVVCVIFSGMCSNVLFYAIDFCVSIYAFHAFV